MRIARSCTGFVWWVHHIDLGSLEQAAASATLWCAALCCAALYWAALRCIVLCYEDGEVLPARLLPTVTVVISFDVLVVLILNMTGMQASKVRSGTASRVISSSDLSSGQDRSAQGTHCRALEALCDAEWLSIRFVQAALTCYACCIKHELCYACCATLCCIVLCII